MNDIQITKIGDKYEVTIKQGKQARWFTIDEKEAKELLIKLSKEVAHG